MEIKYTSDGKKVGIVGKLNSQETIVQEIFVSAGQEIPSGENFVVKSLHDAPAVSWKVKNAEEEEAECKQRMLVCDKLKKEIRYEHDRLKSLLNSIRRYKTDDQFLRVFDSISDFLTGSVTHLVKLGWSCEITPFIKATAGGEYDRDYMKLISLFGGSGGDLQWKIHSYSDGSGGSECFIPAKSHENAVEILSNYINSQDKISSYHFAAIGKYGIAINPEKLKEYKDGLEESALALVDRLEKDLIKAKESVLAITQNC